MPARRSLFGDVSNLRDANRHNLGGANLNTVRRSEDTYIKLATFAAGVAEGRIRKIPHNIAELENLQGAKRSGACN